VSDEPPPLAAVLGRNAKALRGQRRTDDVAKAVRARGLNWGSGRISELEAGRVVPRVETLMLVAAAFTDLTGRQVLLSDLFAGSGRVAISDSCAADLKAVRDAVSGAPVRLAIRTTATYRGRGRASGIARECGEAEQRAAAALGVDLATLVDTMSALWGHTLTVERDRLAGPEANAQTRGRITRALRDQLRKAIDDGDS
jgi:hypothetical protein